MFRSTRMPATIGGGSSALLRVVALPIDLFEVGLSLVQICAMLAFPALHLFELPPHAANGVVFFYLRQLAPEPRHWHPNHDIVGVVRMPRYRRTRAGRRSCFPADTTHRTAENEATAVCSSATSAIWTMSGCRKPDIPGRQAIATVKSRLQDSVHVVRRSQLLAASNITAVLR